MLLRLLSEWCSELQVVDGGQLAWVSKCFEGHLCLFLITLGQRAIWSLACCGRCIVLVIAMVAPPPPPPRMFGGACQGMVSQSMLAMSKGWWPLEKVSVGIERVSHRDFMGGGGGGGHVGGFAP